MHSSDNKNKEMLQVEDLEHAFVLSPYPINMSPWLPLANITLDEAGIPFDGNPAQYHPTTIAQFAFAHWNQYLATNDEYHRNIFLTQAHWLVEHEVRIGDDAGGWPISSPHSDVPTQGLWLSALAQGSGISVLTRAYQLTEERTFLEVACRAVRTFERDILDGGVSTPVGGEGIFFEEVAAYPATHKLSGFIFALFGLYDYVALTGDAQIEMLIHRSLATMHNLLDEFDLGFWTCSDLLHRRLASDSQLALQCVLLEALARYSGCDHCLTLASRWKSYQHQIGSRLRYLIASRSTRYGHAVLQRVRKLLFPKTHISPTTSRPTVQAPLRVCVPITAFPVTGGMRTGLTGVAQVMKNIWQMEYLTQHIGPNPEQLIIHRFGTALMTPRQFPFVWLYAVAGFRKLLSLLRHGAGYHVILPQDGVFTSAFAAPVAKLAGLRAVCMDYGNMTLLESRIYRAERIKDLASRSLPYRLLGPLLFRCYWPSLYLLAWISTRFVDHFLVAGLPGDGVEEVYCGLLGVHPSRLTRYPYTIDVERHVLFDTETRAKIREKYGIATDAIVIIMLCRLAPEKGVDIGVESIDLALSLLSPEQRKRVRTIIAGDGPLRKQVEEDIRRRGLSETCLLWGEASRSEVVSLLGISDIFLHTSTRGAYYTLSILEAMASSCAVVASTQPSLNVELLAEGRGMVVPAGDAQQTAHALIRSINDPQLRRQMGNLARDYIAEYHSGTKLRRVLLRATCWSALDQFLHGGMEGKS